MMTLPWRVGPGLFRPQVDAELTLLLRAYHKIELPADDLAIAGVPPNWILHERVGFKDEVKGSASVDAAVRVVAVQHIQSVGAG